MKKNHDQIINDAVTQLLDMFETGKLPAKVAFSIIHRHPNDVIPSDKWSIGNRILQMLQGTDDARGYKQWQEAGRQVRKGAHAIHILAPMTFKVKETDKDTGEEVEKVVVKGYRPIPVFRYEDTEGSRFLCTTMLMSRLLIRLSSMLLKSSASMYGMPRCVPIILAVTRSAPMPSSSAAMMPSFTTMNWPMQSMPPSSI